MNEVATPYEDAIPIYATLTLHRTGTRNEREVRFLGTPVGKITVNRDRKGTAQYVGKSELRSGIIENEDWFPIALALVSIKIALN